MSYKITYQEYDGGVVTVYRGTVTDKEMVNSANERITPTNKVKSYKYLLSDFTNVDDFKITTNGIKAVANISNLMFQLNANILVVIVVPSDLKYGMGRMWQAYTCVDDENKTQIARTRDEAIEWLKQNLKT